MLLKSRLEFGKKRWKVSKIIKKNRKRIFWLEISKDRVLQVAWLLRTITLSIHILGLLQGNLKYSKYSSNKKTSSTSRTSRTCPNLTSLWTKKLNILLNSTTILFWQLIRMKIPWETFTPTSRVQNRTRLTVNLFRMMHQGFSRNNNRLILRNRKNKLGRRAQFLQD